MKSALILTLCLVVNWLATDQHYPSSVSTDSSNESTVSWANPTNALTANSTYATATLGALSTSEIEATYTEIAEFTGFDGLDEYVQETDVIRQVIVKFVGHATTTGKVKFKVRLIKDGEPVGNWISSNGTLFSQDSTTDAGGTTDDQGFDVSLTGADVLSSNFGVQVVAFNTSMWTNQTVYCDCVKVFMQFERP